MRVSASTETDTQVNFQCLDCGVKEAIPREVVLMMDGTDIEYAPTSAPRFSCAKCGGTMYYRNELGDEFRLNDERMK